MALLSGCAWPRGAALQSEFLGQANGSEPEFSVVEVTRAKTAEIAKWPATGWDGRYVWLQSGGAGSGPVVRPGDTIDLVIWDSDPSSLITPPNATSAEMRNMTVSPSGTIFVPYAGEVVINGLTPDGARAQVQREIERIAPSAQVQLAASQGVANTAYLVRGVSKPGPVVLPSRNFTILSMISQGGGIATNLRNPLVRLIRGGRTYEIPAADLLSNASRNIVIRGGDKVIVDEDGRQFIALGTTGTEKIVRFNKEHITATEALSMAGGLADNRADLAGVLILREYPESAVRADGVRGPEMNQVVFSFDFTSAEGVFAANDFQVNPGDVLIGTEAPLVGINAIANLALTGIRLRAGI